jgi:hypothetical protein
MAAATLSSIAVTPAAPSIAKGTTQQLTATGTYSDGTTKDITAMVTWTSGTAATATVSAAGLATGVAGGTSVITAAMGTVMGSTTLTVTVANLVSIAITPGAQTIATGTKQQFTATGTFKDAANVMTTQDLTAMVTWTSSMTNFATITAAGLASAVAVGTTTITATSGTGATAIMGTTTLTVKMADLVSIAVTTTTPSIVKGTTATFVATGTFADQTTQNLTTQVTWTSATPGTATIAATGVATSVAPGTTVISAKLGTITGMLTLTVTAPTLVSIAVTADVPVPSAPQKIAHGTKVQLIATGTFNDGNKQDITANVTWASSAAAVAVSNAAATKGLATAGANAGMATVTATFGTGAAAISGMLVVTVTAENLVSIVVTPATQTIAKGTTVQYKATGFFTDTSQQDLTETAAWSSSNAGNATVSNVAGTKGLATGVAVGATVITAAVGPINDTADLTVSNAIPTKIDITPATPTVALGTTLPLTATGTFSDGTKQDLTATVTWASATATVATISNAAGSNGKVTPVAKGTSVITAAFTFAANQTVTGMTTLTVSDAVLKSIAVTAAGSKTTIEKGTTLQLTATGTFTDNTTADLTKMVTWASTKATVATVSNVAASAGLVNAVATGTVTISATSTVPSMNGQPTVGTIDLIINDGKLVSIAIKPANPKIAAGTKVQFIATGTFDDLATQDITGSVAWSSDTPTKATIDATGLASGVAMGSAKITATVTGATAADTVTGTTTLTVSSATLMAITLDPHPALSIAKGTKVQFTATGFFDDLTTQDLTDTVTWASSTANATISNDPASNGLATGAAVGMSMITASLLTPGGTITSGPVTLTVTAATLMTVVITPANAMVPKGATIDLVATGVFTDNTMQVLTNTVTWTTAAAATATISNAAGQHGRATGIAPGMVVITATSTAATGSRMGMLTLTVTPAAVVSIAITPGNQTIVKTATKQYTATATLTDGTKQDISTTATWTSSMTAIATISTSGLATGVAAGMTTISAASGGVMSTNTPTLTVTN